MRLIFTLLILLFINTAHAIPPRIDGLMKNGAIINENGQIRFLRVGSETQDGYKLISANPEQAVFEKDGTLYPLGISQHIMTEFSAGEPVTPTKPTQLVVKADSNGRYIYEGEINGRSMDFIIDTGADVVTLSSKQAENFRIKYKDAEKSIVETAQGKTEAHTIQLQRVEVGGLVHRKVKAVVLEGEYPSQPLLGLSFLNNFDFSKEGDALTIKIKGQSNNLPEKTDPPATNFQQKPQSGNTSSKNKNIPQYILDNPPPKDRNLTPLEDPAGPPPPVIDGIPPSGDMLDGGMPTELPPKFPSESPEDEEDGPQPPGVRMPSM